MAQEALATAGTIRNSKHGALLIYVVAFVTGAIVMSFEMLGSRYLNPYFGSGIYTWASLISTVLASLTAGYFIGGWLADRISSAPVLGVTILIGSVYVILLPSFAQELLELVLDSVDDVKSGSLLAALAILFFPVTFLIAFPYLTRRVAMALALAAAASAFANPLAAQSQPDDLTTRIKHPSLDKGELLTDDFAPVNLFLNKEICDALAAQSWSARGDVGRETQPLHPNCRKKKR